MYEYLINEYIKNMTINDIIDYGFKNNIDISIKDASILLAYAKKYYKVFLNGNDENILKEIKKKIDPITYDKAYSLYIINKSKYLR